MGEKYEIVVGRVVKLSDTPLHEKTGPMLRVTTDMLDELAALRDENRRLRERIDKLEKGLRRADNALCRHPDLVSVRESRIEIAYALQEADND